MLEYEMSLRLNNRQRAYDALEMLYDWGNHRRPWNTFVLSLLTESLIRRITEGLYEQLNLTRSQLLDYNLEKAFKERMYKYAEQWKEQMDPQIADRVQREVERRTWEEEINVGSLMQKRRMRRNSRMSSVSFPPCRIARTN